MNIERMSNVWEYWIKELRPRKEITLNQLVVFKSISGFTKIYAQWITEALDSPCIEIGQLSQVRISSFDVIIFRGSLHALGINSFNVFKKYIPIIGPGRVVLFAVGASPPKPGIEDSIRNRNIDRSYLNSIPLFNFRGGFDYSKLDPVNKMLMRLLRWKMMLHRNKTDDETGMLASYASPLDATCKTGIDPLVSHVKERQEAPA